MNRGTPPTAPNARTGEFTPPGVTSRARGNSDPLRGVGGGAPPEPCPRGGVWGGRPPGPAELSATLGLAGVDDVLQQPQRVRQRMLLRRAQPARGQPVRVIGRRGEHVAVAAVPAQAFYDVFQLAVKAARPPFVFV